MQYFSSTAKLGILGGGQLGKMLLYTTRKWDITTHVLDPSQSAPAKLACDHFTQGDFKDYQQSMILVKTSMSSQSKSNMSIQRHCINWKRKVCRYIQVQRP